MPVTHDRSPARDPARVLIVLLGAIGDVTRALPLLTRLRRGMAQTEFFWAVEPASAPLLEGHSSLAGVIAYDRRKGARDFLPFLARVRRVRADWSVDLQRHLKSGLVAFASGARRRIGFDRANSREGNFVFQTEHVPPMSHFSSKLEQFQAFADHLGIAPAPIDFGLQLHPEEDRQVEQLLEPVARPFAAFFVGSTADSRLWFPERTALVVEALHERGLATVLVGGPGEERFSQPIATAARSRVLDLTGRTTLRQLFGVFRRAQIGIGPDCGPMHIAAAAGIPVVSLWGATSAARSAPLGSHHLAIEGPAPCSPCYRKHCDIGRICMQAISVEQVLARVDIGLRARNEE